MKITLNIKINLFNNKEQEIKNLKIKHLQIQLNYVRKSNDFEPKYTIKKSKHANSTKENEPNTIEEI